jgi:bifunctional non-homologous end joining protein LigD
VAGRPNNGGSQVKHKFYATLTARVSSINAQRSVEISVIHENRWFPAGNVTIPSNFALPKVNKLVEIKYLYAFQATGRLFQPIYLGVRDDLVPQDCSKDQLKYKNTDEEDIDSI